MICRQQNNFLHICRMRYLKLLFILCGVLFSSLLTAQPVVDGHAFDAVVPFKGELTEAWKNGRCGLINKKGETRLDFKYDFLYLVGNYGVVTGNAGIYRFCDLKGQPIVDLALEFYFAANDSLVYGLNNRSYTWYIINFKSRKVVTVNNTNDFFYNGEDLFKVRYLSGENWYLLRPDGSHLLSYPLKGANKASGGRMLVRDTTGRNRLLDIRGKDIPLPKNWSALAPLDEMNGLFAYEVNGKYGLADSLLRPLLPPDYDWIGLIDNSPLLRINKGKLFGVANKQGKIILPCESPDKCVGVTTDQNHFVLETPAYKCRLVNRQGKTILPPDHRYIYLNKGTAYVQTSNGFRFYNLKTESWYNQDMYEEIRMGSGDWFMVKKKGKWGVLTQTLGTLVPVEYDFLTDRDFGTGTVFEVGKGELKGVLSTDNKVLLPLRYKYLDWSGASPGCTWVMNDTAFGVVNMRNEVVIPFRYSNYKYHHTGQNMVRQNGKTGMIDFGGNVIVPLEYEDAERFFGGLAPVKRNGKWGFVDRRAELVIPCIYDKVESFSEGKSKVTKEGRSFYINEKGETVPDIK